MKDQTNTPDAVTFGSPSDATDRAMRELERTINDLPKPIGFNSQTGTALTRALEAILNDEIAAPRTPEHISLAWITELSELVAHGSIRLQGFTNLLAERATVILDQAAQGYHCAFGKKRHQLQPMDDLANASIAATNLREIHTPVAALARSACSWRNGLLKGQYRSYVYGQCKQDGSDVANPHLQPTHALDVLQLDLATLAIPQGLATVTAGDDAQAQRVSISIAQRWRNLVDTDTALTAARTSAASIANLSRLAAKVLSEAINALVLQAESRLASAAAVFVREHADKAHGRLWKGFNDAQSDLAAASSAALGLKQLEQRASSLSSEATHWAAHLTATRGQYHKDMELVCTSETTAATAP